MALARDRLWKERNSTPARIPTGQITGEEVPTLPAPTIPFELLDTHYYRYFLCQIIGRSIWFMRILNVSILCGVIILALQDLYMVWFSLYALFFIFNTQTNPVHRYASGWKTWPATATDSFDDFVDAIITRKSLDPKDKAFGLYSVIGIKLHKSLPPPDSLASLGEIYQDLTTHIFEATGDLKPLFFAAGNGFPDQPSWVPNWSTILHHWWMEPSLEVPPRLGGYYQRMNTNIQHIPITKAAWSVDTHDPGKLTTGGHHYCTVTECFNFEPTKKRYDSTDKEVHTKHIKYLQLLIRSQDPRSRAVFLTGPDDVEEGPGDLHSYWFLLYTLHNFSPASIFSLMQFSRGGRTGVLRYLRIIVILCLFSLSFIFGIVLMLLNYFFVTDYLRSYWFIHHLIMDPDILRVHVRICNDLAKSRRKIFSGVYPSENGEQRVVGICSTDVEVGDKVIVTSGLPSLIIIRPHIDSYKVVSPVAIFEDIPKELKKRLDRSGKEKLDDILEFFTLV